MGKALALYKVYAEEGYNLDTIMEDLKKYEKVKYLQKEPIAFGIVILKVGILFDDKADNPEKLEEEIRTTVKGIKEMECDDVTLIS
jgi:translation elongation factor EF-1beta